MNVSVAIFIGPNPFPHHFFTHNVFTINITDLAMDVSCIEAFSTEKTYYITHFAVIGILNKWFRNGVYSFPTDVAIRRACAKR